MKLPRVSSPRAFTLIELLTVIAIIGILAAILIPVVGKVRATARAAVGTSNLHQIATACLIYANDNRGYLPQGNVNGGNSATAIRTTLTKYIGNGSDANLNAIFTDPSARLPFKEGASWTGHFSFHPVFFPDLTNTSLKLRKLETIADVSRKIFVADGVQTPEYDNDAADNFYAEGLCYEATSAKGTTNYATGWTSPPDLIANRGRIAFRMASDSKAKVAFGDAAVKVVAASDLRGVNFTAKETP
jgi:prepilin-type N-terminal cleavage/methylation domain-containing protein